MCNDFLSNRPKERLSSKIAYYINIIAQLYLFTGQYPSFSDVFVRERDLYLCHSLQVAALPQEILLRPTKVVGVVGMGHAKGITENWGKVEQHQITQILRIPPASLSNRVFKFAVKYGTITLIGYGVFRLIKPRFKTIM